MKKLNTTQTVYNLMGLSYADLIALKGEYISKRSDYFGYLASNRNARREPLTESDREIYQSMQDRCVEVINLLDSVIQTKLKGLIVEM